MGLLRLLLALSVVFAHSGAFVLTGNHFVGGMVAVESFFMISGFYMALVLENKYGDDRKRFYQNRFLRIFPTYWFILFLAICISYGLGDQPLDRLIPSELSWDALVLMWSANFLIFGSDVMMFFSSGADGLFFTANFQQESVKLYEYHYIPQAWTLPLELMFYLAVPFFFQKKYVIAALILASLVIKLAVFQLFGTHDPWSYRFFPAELMMFCLGMVSHQWYVFLKNKGWLSRFLGLAALLVTVFVTLFFENIIAGLQIKMAVYFLLLLMCIPFIFNYCQHNRVDRFIGELSYPVYLCHLIVIVVVNYLDLHLWSDQSLLYVMGTLLLATGVHVCVSEPIEKRFRAR